jgi:deoxyribonuclease-4
LAVSRQAPTQKGDDTVSTDKDLHTSPTVTRPLLGAHIRTAGGLALVPGRAVAIGAEVVQIFNSNPRTWRVQIRSPEEVASLREDLRSYGLPLYYHSIYLINLAATDAKLRHRSVGALAEALFLGALTEARGVVTHIGSRHDRSFADAADLVITGISDAFLQAKERLATEDMLNPLPHLLLETSAGSGTTLGARLDELAALLSGLPASGLPASCGVCLDTAHLFAAGYPIHTEQGLEKTIHELETHGLLGHVRLVHLNDSKTALASSIDRHENLGDGRIGLEGLSRFVRHPAFRDVPFVLEVPGLSGHGPDVANMERAKSMRQGLPVPPTQPARPAWPPEGPG